VFGFEIFHFLIAARRAKFNAIIIYDRTQVRIIYFECAIIEREESQLQRSKKCNHQSHHASMTVNHWIAKRSNNLFLLSAVYFKKGGKIIIFLVYDPNVYFIAFSWNKINAITNSWRKFVDNNTRVAPCGRLSATIPQRSAPRARTHICMRSARSCCPG
jgi:hypothetical protein